MRDALVTALARPPTGAGEGAPPAPSPAASRLTLGETRRLPPHGGPGATVRERDALDAELRHWRRAAASLADLDLAAPPAAWAALESYLGRRVRQSLHATANRVSDRAALLHHALRAAHDPRDLPRLRQELLRLRADYLRAEAVIDFFCDAVVVRTSPRLGAVLRGLDALAVAGMEPVLRPLDIPVPSVLTYPDRGIGASILRAGARLWDDSLSPAAAIKITRHNLWRPTSLLHEVGHQVAHLTGWTAELAEALYVAVAPVSRFAADAWRGWAGEVAADVYAFALLGPAPLPALATVVDGPTPQVFRMAGDVHPFGYLRVLFNVALCRAWYGPGRWDETATAWIARHPLAGAPQDAAAVTRASLPLLPALAELCTRAPMRAFGGRALSSFADPRKAAPDELERFAQRAGAALYTSTHLMRLEPMRILAWTVWRGEESRDDGGSVVETWLRRVGGEAPPARTHP